jgi:amino acid adenylation domain-containing protein
MIGFFVNTLVLRGDLSGKPSFRNLLKQVRNVALEAYAHPELPFEHLVDAIQPERNLSYSPLFQVMLNLQNTPARNLQIAGATTREVKIDNSTAKFDLTLSLDDSGPQLTGWMEYNTDLFEAGTIRRMLVHYQTSLQAAIQNPDQSISALPLLPEGERRRMLVEWNDTKRGYPQACVHEMFEAQVEKGPEAVALVAGEQQLSYAELNRRANQLAQELRSKGVGPESVVGVCVERSPDLLVAFLGVLKAGGAYVPLDPAFPRERLLFMLRDAGVQVLLTQENLRAKLSESTARFICLDSDWATISKRPSDNFMSRAGPENLAYVIYTSGSTGQPKGVEIPHRALSNFLASMQLKPGLTEKDALLAVTTASFDIAALELYLPLTVGARVILVSRDVATDGQRLREALTVSGATCMQATPTTWRMLVNAGWEGSPQLKILCGGEALSRELANELAGRAASVWNMYGPTETTVWSAMHQITATTGPVLVGRPIANTELYVLDAEMQPLPIGVPGELYIGGDGLARGYRNRPELTAEKFVPHPFNRETGARLYNTGDRARYRADGSLELLGRRDHQVKIRGFRVELGEIEAALAEHPALQATVVVVREDAPGEPRLVAYAVPEAGSLARAEELRSFLKTRLPDYMLPARFEFLDSLPVNPSGKVDRRALPAPGSERLGSEASYVAPRTEQEKKLAAIWADVLQLDRVSVHDNFFDLGGHSLLAVKLVARVESALGKKLPVISIFQLPTISELAPLLTTAGSPEKVGGVVPVQPTGSKPPFFCIGASPIFRPLALRLGPDQPFLGLTTLKSDMCGLPAPFKLEDIAAGLVRRLRSLQPNGPYFLGGWCQDGVFAYEVAQQLLAQGEKVGLLVLFEAWNPARLKEYSGLDRSGIRLRRPIRKVAFHLANLRRHGLRETLADYKWRLQFRNIRHKIWYGYYRFLLAAQGQVDDRFRKFFRAGYFTVRDYVPHPYPERTLLVRSGFDPQRVNEPSMGWSGLLVGKSEFQFVPGGHKRMFLEPNVDLLANTLKRCLSEAQGTENESELPTVNLVPGVQ